MSKKFEDLTFKEAAEICYINTGYFGNCDEHCPLKNNCGKTKHIRIITYDKKNMEQEIEVYYE